MTPWWQAVLETLRADFSDLPDAAGVTRLVSRLLIAALVGAILGYEREWHGKDAGLRTHMFVSLGSAFFVLVPQQAGMAIADISRVLQGIITGIGFVGAGAILKLTDQRRIEGLTTAAGIWLTSAVGIAAGMGRGSTALLGTLLALVILLFLGWLEEFTKPRGHQLHTALTTPGSENQNPISKI